MLPTPPAPAALAPTRPLFPSHPDTALQALLVPEVRTSSRPSAGYLLSARKIIEKNKGANQALADFREGRAPFWELSATLDNTLRDNMPAPIGANAMDVVAHQMAINEVALYLTAEIEQLPVGVLVTSKLTGKAVACLKEEHFWQPPDVPREGGGMATPLMRLRPDVEAFLYHHHAEEHRFEGALEIWRGRLAPDVLPGGRDKLALVTPSGRQEVIDALRSQLPKLLSRAQGTAKAFLQLVRPRAEVSEGFERVGEVTINADQTLKVPDALSVNPAFDPGYALGAKVTAAWATGIAQAVVDSVRDGRILCQAPEEGTVWLYLAPPDETKALRAAGHTAPLLVIWGPAPIVGVVDLDEHGSPPAGLFVPDEEGYRIEGRELHDRWEIRAQIKGTLYMDPKRLRVIDIGDVPVTGLSVEIL